MIEKELIVQIKQGLHARPAAKLVQGIRNFSATIELSYRDKTYNPKSILSIMSSQIKEGDSVTIKATGDDEQEVISWFEGFFSGDY